MSEDDLNETVRGCEEIALDPAIAITTFLLVQTWGRKGAAGQ
jgi:hypothetical protein